MSELETYQPEDPRREEILQFSQFVQDVLAAGVPKVDIAEKFGVGFQIIDRWVAGDARPQSTIIEDVMAEYSHVLNPEAPTEQ